MDAHALLLSAQFLADVGVTAGASWLMVVAAGHSGRGFLEAVLAWFLALVALVTGVGVLLGETGGFGPTGFLLGHATILGGLMIARRGRLASDGRAALDVVRWAGAFLRRGEPERFIAAGLAVILVMLTLIAAWAEPAVVDSLTYHLPRVGHWLQTGRIDIIPTTDARLNFVAVLPDVMIAWLVGGSAEGFGGAVIAQALGGLMTVGATVGLARQTGLGRGAALLAGMLLMGMANVVVQFTAAQTDLFTTGIFAAAFYLWVGALRRGEASVLAAIGAGVALGAKGTVFYLAPGALLWTGWLALKHRMPWRQWRTMLLAGALGVVVFAGPGFWRNVRAYGDPLGPEEWVRKHHQGYESLRELGRKLALNLSAAVAQDLEPHSQPAGLRGGAREVGLAIAKRLPADDPYTLDGRNRQETLAKAVLTRASPDADVTAFGVVTTALFFVGTGWALLRRRAEEHRLVAIWSGGVLLFVGFFHAMQQWHPFAFRYLVLAAPWVAVVSAWALEQLPGRARWMGWAIAIAAALNVGWHVTTRVHQAGWRSVMEPARSEGSFVAQAWRAWSEGLDHETAPLGIALTEERPLSAFYRQRVSRRVEFVADRGADVSAEELVGTFPGWVVVPATRFIGREGRVAGSTWLFAGDERSPFSVAAYRRLNPGEKPQPLLYRNLVRRERGGWEHDLLVKTWSDEPVRFSLQNRGEATWRFVMLTASGAARGEVAANTDTAVAVALAGNEVSQVRFRLEPVGQAAGEVPPVLTLGNR